MTAAVLLFAVSLLHSTEVKGSKPTFVQHGADLLLDVKTAINLTETQDFFWKFNKTFNVAKSSYDKKSTRFGKYKNRAQFFVQNYSLLLKNVDHNDSGNYIALVSGEKDTKVTDYKVVVQDPVPAVKLTVTTISSAPCNLTVTCRTVDSRINSTFTCATHNCSKVEKESSRATTDSSSLIVYLQQGAIVCNHSNDVSSKQDKREIKSYCGTNPAHSAATTIAIGTAFGGVAFLTAIVLTVILILRKCKRESKECTVYAVSQDINPGQNPDAAGLSSTSTYALVQFHDGPKQTNMPKNPSLPETVYAEVNRDAKSNFRAPITNT